MKRFLSASWVTQFSRAAFVLALMGTVLTLLSSADSSDSRRTWPLMGQGLGNLRNSQSNSNRLSTDSVSRLRAKWIFMTGGDVSATPAVADNQVYFPDWAGNLYAVDENSGKLIFSHQISEYNNVPGSISRVTPAVHGDDLIIGDIQDPKLAHAGTSVMAINRKTGKLHWITKVDIHPAAIIAGSPVVFDNMVYVGVSSNEEGLASASNYPCCSFRGSMVALDANSGNIIWQTYLLPDNHGQPGAYSGNAIWQPPAIDPRRGSLYVGSGNNYQVPEEVKACIDSKSVNDQSSCFAADDHFDTALSLDLRTGAIKWSRRLQGVDVWTVACIQNPNPVGCPIPSSPDYDLGGSGPNLLPGMVGFGQKSGMYWALNPDTGDILWGTVVGPGGTLGGIEWGTASDGKRIYAAITNSRHVAYPLIDGTSTTGGAWSAIDPANGKILWQTADPSGNMALGSVSTANGIVFAPSVSGNMHALDARTGKILWSFQSGGSVIDGPSIVDGMVFWGSGYGKVGGTPNNKVFAFAP